METACVVIAIAFVAFFVGAEIWAHHKKKEDEYSEMA